MRGDEEDPWRKDPKAAGDKLGRTRLGAPRRLHRRIKAFGPRGKKTWSGKRGRRRKVSK